MINSFVSFKVVQSTDFQFSGFCKLYATVDLVEIESTINESEQVLTDSMDLLSSQV